MIGHGEKCHWLGKLLEKLLKRMLAAGKGVINTVMTSKDSS